MFMRNAWWSYLSVEVDVFVTIVFACPNFTPCGYWTVLNVFTVNDTLDDMLNESGDEEEQDAIVNQVLDEIGIEISGKVGTLG